MDGALFRAKRHDVYRGTETKGPSLWLSDWLKEYRTEIGFLNDLAEKEGVVVMYGPGFEAPEGTVRISLANLNKEDYTEIARRLYELLDQYYEIFEAETGKALPDAA